MMRSFPARVECLRGEVDVRESKYCCGLPNMEVTPKLQLLDRMEPRLFEYIVELPPRKFIEHIQR